MRCSKFFSPVGCGRTPRLGDRSWHLQSSKLDNWVSFGSTLACAAVTMRAIVRCISFRKARLDEVMHRDILPQLFEHGKLFSRRCWLRDGRSALNGFARLAGRWPDAMNHVGAVRAWPSPSFSDAAVKAMRGTPERSPLMGGTLTDPQRRALWRACLTGCSRDRPGQHGAALRRTLRMSAYRRRPESNDAREKRRV